MEENTKNSSAEQGIFEEKQNNQISGCVKLTNAVYKLLDFFPEGDPLKNRAKDKVLEIMEGMVLIFGTEGRASFSRSQSDRGSSIESGQKDKASSKLLEDIEVLLSYLKLGKSFGWIDSTNFLIVSKEYGSIKSQIVLPKNQDLMPENVSKIRMQSSAKAMPEVSQREGILAESQKITHTFQKTVERNQISFSKEFYPSDRQKKILEILREKGKAQVSDFKAVLSDVTKRTIRRDLDELLKNGKVMRVGEWNQVFYQIS